MTASATSIAARRPRPPLLARLISRLVMLVGGIPYALIAIGLRLLMARVFFPDGQSKIEGPAVSFKWLYRNADFTVTLPTDISDAALQMMQTQYAHLPISPTTAAYLFTYAEFVLPICLVIGFATRFAAFGLLVMTLLIQFYVMPQLWWSTHVYWVAILMVLMTVGPGAVSIDALIRHLYGR